MAGRKKSAPLTLAELEKQRDALNEQIRSARTKRKQNFQAALTALAENELAGENSITGFDIETLVGALLDAKKRSQTDTALLEQFRTTGRKFIDSAQSQKAEPDPSSASADSSPNDKSNNDTPSESSSKMPHVGTNSVTEDRQSAG
jgi:hypothetical protein